MQWEMRRKVRWKVGLSRDYLRTMSQRELKHPSLTRDNNHPEKTIESVRRMMGDGECVMECEEILKDLGSKISNISLSAMLSLITRVVCYCCFTALQ